MRATLLRFTLLFYLGLSSALGQVFVCTSPDGTPLYTNTATNGKCRKLDVSISTMPAVSVGGKNLNATPAKPSSAVMPTTPPPGQPPLPNTMRSTLDIMRSINVDPERRKVLEEQLKSEEARVATLRTEFNGGEPERRGDERNYQKYLDRTQQLKDDLGRGEDNIRAIKRELGQ